MGQTVFAKLRDVLAYLYPDELNIRRIVADAGINGARMTLNSTALNNWYSVLTEAEKTNQVDILLDIVKKEYGTNQEFLKACVAYRLQNEQHEIHKIATTYSSTKIIRECLEQSFDSESIRVFCQNYFDAVFRRLRPFDGLDQVITEIIKYSGQHNKFDYLWQIVKIENSSMYEIYFPQWQNLIRN